MMPMDFDQDQAVSKAHVILRGVPWDANSSFRRGAAEAPTHIRRAFHSVSGNYFSENGIDLQNHPLLEDRGDLPITKGGDATVQIETAVANILREGHQPLLLGGDHALTYPALKAVGTHYQDLTVIHFDAHPDLYDELNGNRLSHACPFARAMESGQVAHLIQIGIRSTTHHQREQARRFGVEVFEMRDRPWRRPAKFAGPLYISIDLDVLDPAFAPGVSHFEPGGMATRELIDILQGIEGSVVGADIVEFNPQVDPSGLTAMVAAKLLKELVALMMTSNGSLEHRARPETGIS